MREREEERGRERKREGGGEEVGVETCGQTQGHGRQASKQADRQESKYLGVFAQSTSTVISGRLERRDNETCSVQQAITLTTHL